MRHIALLCACSLSLISTAQAQVDYPALDAKITWQLDTNGSLMIAPDPSAGGASDAHTRVFAQSFLDPASYRNLGTYGILLALMPGRGDIVSLTDGERLFKRIGYGLGDAELLQRIRGTKNKVNTARAQRIELERILAMRIAEKRGLKAAIGVLKQVAKDDQESPSLRRVAEDVIRKLKGEPHAPHAQDLAPLKSVLALVPKNSEAVIVVDQRALPSARKLVPFMEPFGIGVTKSVIDRTTGTLSTASWAGARMLSCQGGVLPYELALRFGNFSLHRTVVAAINMLGGHPVFWIHFEGDFDLARLELGLRAEGAQLEKEGEDITAEFGTGNPILQQWRVRIRASSKRVIVQALGFEPAGGETHANMLVKQGLDLDAAIAFVRLPDQGQVGALAKIAAREDFTQILRTLTIKMPEEGSSALRLHAVMHGETTATMVSDWLNAPPVLFNGESIKNPIVLKMLNAITLEQEKMILDCSIPIEDIDLPALGRWSLSQLNQR